MQKREAWWSIISSHKSIIFSCESKFGTQPNSLWYQCRKLITHNMRIRYINTYRIRIFTWLFHTSSTRSWCSIRSAISITGKETTIHNPRTSNGESSLSILHPNDTSMPLHFFPQYCCEFPLIFVYSFLFQTLEIYVEEREGIGVVLSYKNYSLLFFLSN